MKAYQSMTKKLAPTNLYTAAPGKALDSELKSLACGIDFADDRLDLIIREAFIPTAERDGLTVWEEIFGPPHLSTSAPLRRELLIKRLRLGGGCFTLKGTEEILAALGLTDFTITEKPSQFTVVIDLTSRRRSAAEKKWIRDQLDELLPAHLEIAAVFGNISWDKIDALHLTAQQMDDRNLSWDTIDSLEL